MTADEQAAADAAKPASDQAATDKAAADKAAADKTAADAAAAAAKQAGKTPEQIAADTAAATELARTAAEKAKAPETYELKLPDASKHLTDADLAIIGAEAKALGLTNDQAQALVQARHDQLSTVGAAFLADAKADPEIGGAHFDQTVKHAIAGRDWLFPPGPESELIKSWFDRTGLGNHKAFLRAMARIGKARAEDTNVAGGSAASTKEKSAEERMYPSMFPAAAH